MAEVGAIDIGGTKIAVGVVDEHGRVLVRRECSTDAGRGYRDALVRMGAMLREAVRESGRTIRGIGIGSTGPVDPVTGVIGRLEFLPGWEGSPLVGDLAREHALTYTIHTPLDASLASADEARRARGLDKVRRAIAWGAPLAPLAYTVHVYLGDAEHDEAGDIGVRDDLTCWIECLDELRGDAQRRDSELHGNA